MFLEVNRIAEGKATYYKTESKTRIIDDQSREVPAVFNEWKQQEGLLW